jgi:integral membrane sensor domain MASE1
VAAICVRLFSDAPARFDTLRRVGVFIAGAVLVAPFVSSFPAAAAVSGLLHEPYWLVWRTRFFSNVLTELTLVPAIVTVITWRFGRGGSTTFRRYIEAALLAVATVTVSVVVMAEPIDGASTMPGAPYTALALFLPFILWAAVRFVLGGVCLSVLLFGEVLVLGTLQPHGPFAAQSSQESALAINLFLSVTAVPLLMLAAVFDERRRPTRR